MKTYSSISKRILGFLNRRFHINTYFTAARILAHMYSLALFCLAHAVGSRRRRRRKRRRRHGLVASTVDIHRRRVVEAGGGRRLDILRSHVWRRSSREWQVEV